MLVHTTCSRWDSSPSDSLDGALGHALSAKLCSLLRENLTCGTLVGSMLGGDGDGQQSRARGT